jgi:hypothetical protein
MSGVARFTLARRDSRNEVFPLPILAIVENRDVLWRTRGAPLTGFVYVVDGTLRMERLQGSTDVPAGTAADVPDEAWGEIVTGPAPASYYAFFVSDESVRAMAIRSPTRTVLLGPPICSLRFDVAYHLRLEAVTLEPGGRTASQTHGGALAVLVVTGTVEVRQSGGIHEYPAEHEAVYVAPETGAQVFNIGPTPATVVEFSFTPDDRAFARDLGASP